MIDLNALWDNDGNILDIKVKSKEQVETIISEVEAIDLKSTSVPELMAVLRQFGGYGYSLTTLNASRGRSNLIYRVVKHRQRPYYLPALSYPPVEYARLNRASTEGEQMFYGAFDDRTAMFETNLAVGDRFVLSRWAIPEDIQVISLGFSDEVFRLLNSREKNFINVLADFVYTNQEANVMMHDFFAKSFCQIVPDDRPELYNLSIAIARHFSHNPRGQAIIYPSVACKANAQNIVVSKELVDEGIISCHRVMFAQIVDIRDHGPEKEYYYRIMDSADEFSPSGSIKWSGLRWHVDAESF